MATIKSTKLEQSTNGKKHLAKVIFTPQVPDPANQPDVEVIFEVRKVEAAHLDGEPYAVVGPLSCTRMDTRQPYALSDEQQEAVIDAALVRTAEEDGLSWTD